MKANIHLMNGNVLHLDEFATEMILKTIHKGDLGNSLIVIHVADKTGRLKYSIPMTNVAYLEYIE
jgi:hypothetical protein